VADWANHRPNPTARESTVMTAIIPAAPATPPSSPRSRVVPEALTPSPAPAGGAPLVEAAQERGAADDRREAHALARDGEGEDPGERTGAHEGGTVNGQGGPEDGAEGVRAGVPEHRPLAEVGGERGERDAADA